MKMGGNIPTGLADWLKVPVLGAVRTGLLCRRLPRLELLGAVQWGQLHVRWERWGVETCTQFWGHWDRGVIGQIQMEIGHSEIYPQLSFLCLSQFNTYLLSLYYMPREESGSWPHQVHGSGGFPSKISLWFNRSLTQRGDLVEELREMQSNLPDYLRFFIIVLLHANVSLNK